MRLEARDDKRDEQIRSDKAQEDLARIAERAHRDSKVKPVDAHFIQAARVWAEQSRFRLATAVTQQQYFQSIIEPEVWVRVKKNTTSITTFEDCVVLAEAVFLDSCSPFIR